MASAAIMAMPNVASHRVTSLLPHAMVVSGGPRQPLKWSPMTRGMRDWTSKRMTIVCANSGDGDFRKDGTDPKQNESARFVSSSSPSSSPSPSRTETNTTPPGSGGAFGESRKDVILIGLGVILAGVALKSGLEFAGVDPLRAGNVVQITFVFGLMTAWTFSYVFRVANKEMTYVKQLKEYEDAVIGKRLEEMPEAELETMLAEIEEEKRRLRRQ